MENFKRSNSLRFGLKTTPGGRLMLNQAFSYSQYYSDALSEVTKRGLREKVRRGVYLACAPFGYLNDYGTKRIIVDRERAPLVKDSFERYATGTVTLDVLRHFFADVAAGWRASGARSRSYLTQAKVLALPVRVCFIFGPNPFGGLRRWQLVFRW
jgi:DNA invertase Pin-like site-specific DNA recombinase